MGRFSVIGILALYLLLAALYGALTPLGEGPDEPGHAAYVFFLARERRLPDQRQNEVPGEGHQPPLAYVLAAPLVLWLPRDERVVDLPGNRRFVWAGGDQINAAAHGSRERWPWQGAALAWHLARLPSALCGAATVGFTLLAARELDDQRRKTNDEGRLAAFAFRSSPLVLLAAALVAFNPQFLFISGLVSNDALLAALSALLLWLALGRPARSWPAALRRALGLGLVLGLALLTKQSALALAPLTLVGAARALPRERSAGRWLGGALGAGLLALAAAALVSGWWFLRNARLYGDLLGLAAFQAEFATQPFDVGSLAAWQSGLGQLHASFWARFGWMNLAPPAWTPWCFALVELAALAGWLGLALRRRSASSPAWSVVGRRSSLATDHLSLVTHHWSLIALLVLPVFAWVVSFALTAGLVAWQGRLLFPALPGIAILLGAGLAAWSRRGMQDDQKTSRPALFFSLSYAPQMLVALLFALAAWLPLGVIRPAYRFEALSAAEARAWDGAAAYGRFAPAGDRGAELRGWRIDGSRRPGETVQVALLWHALGRQQRDWTVFVHLVDSQDRIVALDNSQPRAGAFPMTQWVAGDWVEDRHRLQLPAAGTYTLRVGLYDPQDGGVRAGLYDAGDELQGNHLELGSLTVAP